MTKAIESPTQPLTKVLALHRGIKKGSPAGEKERWTDFRERQEEPADKPEDGEWTNDSGRMLMNGGGC